MRIKEYYDQLVEANLQSIIINRTEAMGVAMLMVLFYHFQSNWFYPGFIGVDIFLFLSAYGLCRSLESNTIAVFYKRRIQRIFPLYVLMGVGITIIYYLFYHTKLSWLDVFCNLTSLNYWGVGGNVAEWYLSFLLLLYLLFPVIFKISKKAITVHMGGGNFISLCPSYRAYSTHTEL